MAETASLGPIRKDPSIRKTNKPLMEKKRRARINDCLSQLKALVLQALKKDSSQFSKLEKADILELTVKHLRNVQRQQVSRGSACVAGVSDPVLAKYRAGFNECASEVMHYLGSCHTLQHEVKGKLMNHLAGCLQTVNTPPVPQCLQPLHVQIPTAASLVQTATTTISRVPPSLHQTSITLQSQPSLLQSSVTPQIPMVPSSPQNRSSFPGTLHIVPSTTATGSPVALYLGSPNVGTLTSAVPVYSIQVPSSKAVPSYLPSPVESDRSGFSSDLDSPSSHFADHVVYSSPSSSPVLSCTKEENVWRPW